MNDARSGPGVVVREIDEALRTQKKTKGVVVGSETDQQAAAAVYLALSPRTLWRARSEIIRLRNLLHKEGVAS